MTEPDYEAIELVWDEAERAYVSGPKFKFRPGQTVWVWWDYDMFLEKVDVIRFLHTGERYQRWAVTADRDDRPNGLAVGADNMYATREEAVAACCTKTKQLQQNIGYVEDNWRNC